MPSNNYHTNNIMSLRTPAIACAICFIMQISGCASAPVIPAPTPTLQVDDYKLGQGDKITIQVFDEPDLSIESVVGANGIISYSYLGDIVVGGKSVDEVETTISSLLENGYLVNPSVNVTVTQFRPFFINGEVRNPGSYSYQPGLTLDKAIALAGGLTDRASLRKMYIVRGGKNDRKQVTVKMSSQVAPGDSITIEEGFF